jgi:HlyD family secretion protein
VESGVCRDFRWPRVRARVAPALQCVGPVMIPGTSAMDKPIEQARGVTPRRWALIAGAVALVLALAALVPAARRWARADRAIDASRLRVADVVRGDLERDVSAQGRIVAALHPTLFSPAQGIVALAVKAGSEVKQGQLLARVESPELQSRLVQERSTLASLQSDLGRQEIAARQSILRSKQNVDVLTMRRAAADRGRTRAEELFKEGLMNKVDHERSQDDLEVATLELKNAKESAQMERETLEFEVRNRRLAVARQQSIVTEMQRLVSGLAVAAPFDGMVATVNVQDRDAVAQNQALLTVVNLSAFEVEFDIAENYASDMAMGTRAEILYEGKTYPGRVSAVSPEIRDSQVRGTVVFDGETPPGLRQSQRVSVRMVLERKANVVKTARGPFLESGGGRQAYVVENGVAVKREIQVGAVSVSEVEITKGVSPGERIVVSDTSVFEGARTVLIR